MEQRRSNVASGAGTIFGRIMARANMDEKVETLESQTETAGDDVPPVREQDAAGTAATTAPLRLTPQLALQNLTCQLRVSLSFRHLHYLALEKI